MSKSSFGDILDTWEKMEKEKSKGYKSTGQEWRNKKTEPGKKSEAEDSKSDKKLSGNNKTEDRPQIDPMTLWLRRYGVYDKDAAEEKEQREMAQMDRSYLHNMAAEASVDLHGLTQEEAYKTLDNFITECCQRRLKKVLIIHGKGNHSATEPVLSGFVRSFIERDYRLGESGHPDKTEGGKGATWVIIKNTHQD